MSKKRYFSLQEANALLPKIAQRMRKVLQLHSLLRGVAEQLSDVQVLVTPELLASTDAVDCPETAVPILSHARALYACIRDELEAVHALGAQVKDVEKGLVDFRSLRDGVDDVLLCWRLGESQITHYHEWDKGYGARKPLAGHLFVGEPRSVQQV